ncbi:Mis18-binding protein 1 [Exaiptasia diaphana]|nr:Mis18-binding protein 1 [Exaiptasia diaphana]
MELSSTADISSYLPSNMSFKNMSGNSTIHDNSSSSLFSPIVVSPDTRFDALKSQVTEVISSLRTPRSVKDRNDRGSRISPPAEAVYNPDHEQFYQDSVCLPQDVNNGELLDDDINDVEDNQAILAPGGLLTDETTCDEGNKQDSKLNDPGDVLTDETTCDEGNNQESQLNDPGDVLTDETTCDEGNNQESKLIEILKTLSYFSVQLKEHSVDMDTWVTLTETPDTTTSKKPHSLSDWCIKAVRYKSNSPGIIVEGQRPEDEKGSKWHSTTIVKRVNSCLLETKKKSQYHLVGQIQEEVTLQQGFSKAFVKSFKNGFPSNWEKLVQEHFNSVMSPEKKDFAAVKSNQTKKSRAKPAKSYKRNKKDTPSHKNDMTPVEVELKRTSSGRLVKPPLAWWRGQRIMTDGQHNLTGIDPGGEEHTALSVGLYDFDLKLPKDKQIMLQSKVMTPKVAKFNITPNSKKLENKHKNISNKSTKKSIAKNHVVSKEKSSSLTETDDSIMEDNASIASQMNQVMENESKKTQNSKTSAKKPMNVMQVRSGGKNKENEETVDTVRRNISFSDDSDTNTEHRTKPREILNYSKQVELEDSDKQSTELSSQDEEDRRPKNHRQAARKSKDEPIKVSSPEEDSHRVRRTRNQRQATRKNPEQTSKLSSHEEDLDSDRRTRNQRKATRKNPEQTSKLSSHEEDLDSDRRTRNQRQLTRKNQDETNELSSQEEDSHIGRRTRNQRQLTRKNQDEAYELIYEENEQQTKNKKKQLTKKKANHHASDESSQEENDDRHCSLRSKGRTKTIETKNQAFTRPWKTDDNNHQAHNLRLTQQASDMAVEESSDEEEAEAIAAMVSKVRQRRANNDSQEKPANTKKPVPGKSQKILDANEWKEEEILRLTTALHSIPLTSPRFWQKVSETVETRTAQECQSKYEGQLEKKPRKDNTKSKQQKPKQKVVAITGGVGTVKRKRELRDLIQQNNSGYYDDIFDSTPYKKSKTNFKITVDPCSSDNDDDDSDFIENQTNFKTPSTRTPSSRFRPLGPGTSETPTEELISPSLLQPVDRAGMDHYIQRMKQGKRGLYAQTTKVTKTSTPRKAVSIPIPKVNGSVFEVIESPDPDSDEESDDYFSE